MRSPLAVNLTLLLIAAIWGFGFIPQREGMNFVGPVAFNALRFALGALTLLPVLLVSRAISLEHLLNRATLKLGLILGGLLFGGALFQQIGIQYTALANVAFISGLY
ncbi:MAG: EamA family transporter, partial [Arenicella sp.]|nr:EamA family transporter [Arenicella sp.]